jgi:ABC-type hemin transport system ATPase subunit
MVRMQISAPGRAPCCDAWCALLPTMTHIGAWSQALMGPSGAGKSTLMDILAMRKRIGQLSGCLLLDGRPATRDFVQQTSYIPQVSNMQVIHIGASPIKASTAVL